MGIIKLNGEQMCDICGIMLKNGNEESHDCHTIVQEDTGFAKAELDLDDEIEQENCILAEHLASGNMKKALAVRERIRQLVAMAPIIWTMAGDGRGIKKAELDEIRSQPNCPPLFDRPILAMVVVNGEIIPSEAGSGSPDALPNSPEVFPFKPKAAVATQVADRGGELNVGAKRRIGKVKSGKVSPKSKTKKDDGVIVKTADELQRDVMAIEAREKKDQTKKLMPSIGTNIQPQIATVAGGRLCLCGCGTLIGKKSHFAMGHDSKVKAILARVDTGEVKVADLPSHIQAYRAAKEQNPVLTMKEYFSSNPVGAE